MRRLPDVQLLLLQRRRPQAQVHAHVDRLGALPRDVEGDAPAADLGEGAQEGETRISFSLSLPRESLHRMDIAGVTRSGNATVGGMLS